MSSDVIANGFDFDIELLVKAKKQCLRIMEIPIERHERSVANPKFTFFLRPFDFSCKDAEVMALSKKVALTVDLEEWTVPQDFTLRTSARRLSNSKVARIGLNRILKILNVEGVKATFFVTAYFAQQNRTSPKTWSEQGMKLGTMA